MASGSYVKQVLSRMPESPETRATGLWFASPPLPWRKCVQGATAVCCFIGKVLGSEVSARILGERGGNPRQAGGGAQIGAGLVPVQSQLYKAFNTTLS